MADFVSKGKDLYIDGQMVIRGWESKNGWKWFATEEAYKQNSILPNGKIVADDMVYYGLTQAPKNEWSYFSKGELENLNLDINPISMRKLLYVGMK